MDGASYMPGVYKIPMVRMTEMSDETPECKGLKVPRSEMGVCGLKPRQYGLVEMVVTKRRGTLQACPSCQAQREHLKVCMYR